MTSCTMLVHNRSIFVWHHISIVLYDVMQSITKIFEFYCINYLCNIMSVGRPRQRQFAVAVTINEDSLEPTPELSNVIRCEIWQRGPSITTTPIRVAKAKAIAKLSGVIKIQKRIKMKLRAKIRAVRRYTKTIIRARHRIKICIDWKDVKR